MNVPGGHIEMTLWGSIAYSKYIGQICVGSWLDWHPLTETSLPYS